MGLQYKVILCICSRSDEKSQKAVDKIINITGNKEVLTFESASTTRNAITMHITMD